MWLSQMRIGTRLGAGFGFMVVLMLFVAGVGVLQTQRMNANSEDIADNWLPSIEALDQLRGSLNHERRVALRHVLEPDEAGKRAQAEIMMKIEKETLPALIAKYESLISSDAERQLFETVKSHITAWKQTDARLIEASNAGEAQFAEARKLATGESGEQFVALMAALDKSIAVNVEGMQAAIQASRDAYRSALWQLIGAFGVAAAIAGVLSVRIRQSITRPLTQALDQSEAVAAGDLTRQARVDSQDELGQLVTSLNRMTASLSDVVRGIRQSTESIVTASSEIAQGNSDLSGRTEHQAASLQETAASMQQMNDTVRTNSDNARQANQLAMQATSVASQGGSDVDAVVQTMTGIQESSRRIADIISVIDGIAFQTNILALNAAVEAARAGEQGRGFAVVASEVRSLAQRSANAAREIKGLITDSVEKVEQGTAQVNGAGRTIQDVVLQVRKVNDLIAEISSSSTEQSQGVGQINVAVSQLDQTTQQNAALVEQTSAAAESLRQQARQLADAVAVFKVGA
ncbi:MAG: MCP four helix bundle domain-containing protein [Burkholderiales bacterium]|nr:MCP four helix bundle domain-containing protein [Burkholderiales bacterium]MBH2015601.1 MCP four helix bundle domain-containing protein [Burkholderiales bacterium]